MTYNKPNDKSYVDMCIYFDEHIYLEDRNDELLYQYLYLIIYMLACKKNFFVSWDDYDAFSLYMATKVYLRYINPKHQEEEGKIKSVLNYCKNLLYPTKVDFLKENYVEILGSDPHKDGDFSQLRMTMAESVQDDHINSNELFDDIITEFENIPAIIKDVINDTPFRNDKIMYHRLFMSVLLTVAKSVTLSNSTIGRLQRRSDKGLNIESLLMAALVKERDSNVTLWRLDNMYYNLVKLLSFKVRKQCGTKVGNVRKDYELSEEDISAVLMTAYGNVLRDDNEEF